MKGGQWSLLVHRWQAMPWRAARSGLLLLCTLLMASPVLQADSSSTVPLPTPLTLVDALSLANDSHPDLRIAWANVSRAGIRLREVESSYGVNTLLELQPRVASRASVSGVDFEDDSRFGLVIRKRLSDFGRSASRHVAASAAVRGEEAAYQVRRNLHVLEVMEKFFAVILADLAYQAHDESMTVSYFRYKRLADRQASFQQYTDMEVAERELAYRRAYVKRLRSDLTRRQARNSLALALGRPGELSADLAMPDLTVYARQEIPDYHELVDRVISTSPTLEVLRHRIEAAQASVDAVRKADFPVLSAEFEAWEYTDNTSANRDRFRANLKFVLPLFGSTGTKDVRLAEAHNVLFRLQSELTSAEYVLRDRVLELLHGLEVNRAQEVAAAAHEEYRGYYQDHSRALYELELRSDLGNAQAKAAAAMLESTRVRFQRALLWTELDGLLGRPLVLIQEK
ncbi:MAG: TolC family protein [Arenicellales bacterium]|jgi:outer membrane protein TolC|nr:TolC family protein [Arenicellales bacterium]MDP6411980.1 TolC family protein [Arenicellales bacterium]